ncbi:MAG: hypothetical protein ACQR33_06215 [Candidatus Saccharibacteria bacterium]
MTKSKTTVSRAPRSKKIIAPVQARQKPQDLAKGRGRKQKMSQVTRLVLYSAAFVVLVLIGTLLKDAATGNILIVIYGIFALVSRAPSGDLMKMALVMLGYIIVLMVIKNATLAGYFAQYAFLLLLFGFLGSVVEFYIHDRKA